MTYCDRICTIYNTCGINQDKTDWYSHCLESIFDQDYETDVVVSSCLNSLDCINTLKDRFGDKLKVVYYSERYIVNVTFNKTSLVCDQGHDGFFFVDSGVKLTDKTSISQMVDRMMDCSMVSLQVDRDAGFGPIGFQANSETPQITGKDFYIPIGKAINLHAQVFGRELLDKFGLIIPDVFAAYCTESTFSFLNACVGKKWCIVKDIMAHHNKAVDGPSSSQPHWSPVHRNPWNNLLYGRNALDFINDQKAKQAGLGYEECGNIMIHDSDAYIDGFPREPHELAYHIQKYFFSNQEELDYDNINYQTF